MSQKKDPGSVMRLAIPEGPRLWAGPVWWIERIHGKPRVLTRSFDGRLSGWCDLNPVILRLNLPDRRRVFALALRDARRAIRLKQQLARLP